MYIQKAEITNIKSIEHFEIEFKNPAGWHVLIGDNGSGKTTIVRAIALALIGKQEASGIREDFHFWVFKRKVVGEVKLNVVEENYRKNSVHSSLTSNYKDFHVFNKKFELIENYSYKTDNGNDINYLDLNYSKFINYDFLQELACLRTLLLRSNNLSNLEFLNKMKSLIHLDLSNNHLRNIDYLKELKNLNHLDLSNNSLLRHIDTIKELKNLSSLNLSDCDSLDYKPINYLKNLLTLDLSSCNLKDLTFLKSLTNLTTLSLNHNSLQEVAFLKDFLNLTSLELNRNSLTNIDVISELKNLTHLDLSRNKLTNIDVISELKNLTHLDLSGNNISNVESLKELSNLTSLNLSNCNLKNIDFVRELKNLSYLGLTGNYLSDVSVLKELKGIESLDLLDNNLSNVFFLEDLPNLTCVSLMGNREIESVFPKEVLLDIRNVKNIKEFVKKEKAIKIANEKEPNRTADFTKVETSFSSAFGPYRRFEGGNSEWDEVYSNSSLANLAAHLSIFNESVALTEPIKWLKDLNYKTLEKNKESKYTLENLKKLINSEDFLPHNSKLEKISSNGVFFKDGNGSTIAVNQMSDGYRSILSLTFELIRQLVRVYGSEKVFKNIENGEMFIGLPGVVLIDEIDAHLHPTWQTRIGQWFLKYFPQLQFIVTTHSPLVCRACEKGSIWRLAAPGSDEESGEVTGIDRDRLIYGNILDAYGTEVFGTNIAISTASVEKQEELVKLGKKKMAGVINKSEENELNKLRKTFTTDDPIDL